MENFDTLNQDLDNIIRINSSQENADELDFDLDYDPNEMYFALLREEE